MQHAAFVFIATVSDLLVIVLKALGLAAQIPPHYGDLFFLDDPIGGIHMNVFKAGVILAHRLVAVSHGCAEACG